MMVALATVDNRRETPDILWSETWGCRNTCTEQVYKPVIMIHYDRVAVLL